MGAGLRAEERTAPELDRKWAEIIQAETWAEWFDRSDLALWFCPMRSNAGR
jgi:hypothetical protein